MRSAALFALVLASALAMGCSGPRLARSRTVASAPGRHSQYVNPYTQPQAAKVTPSSRTYLGYVPPPPPPPSLNNFQPATRTVSTPVRAAATMPGIVASSAAIRSTISSGDAVSILGVRGFRRSVSRGSWSGFVTW